MFSPMDESFNFLQDNHYEYPYLSHGSYSLTKNLDSSLVQPLPDSSHHYTSSSTLASTVPSLSLFGNNSSSFDSPYASPVSTGNSLSTCSSPRGSSPESIPSTPSSSGPISSSASSASTPAPTSGKLTVAKRGLPVERIKRPANAFMCFRTYFCKNKPREVERHNATVSKITGIAWRRLSDEEKVPYIAQAAAIKAEFMAKHPDWRFKPRRDRPQRRPRRTQKRTLADEQRYTRIALGFNSGKRGKDLKKLAETAETGDIEEFSAPPTRVRRSRKSTATTKASASPKHTVSTRIASPTVESTPQPVIQYTQISAEFQPSAPLIYPIEVPPSPSRHSLHFELQPGNFFGLPPIAHQPYDSEQLDLSSILMEQDVRPQIQGPNVESVVSQLYELTMDSTVTGFFDNCYQQPCSSMMSNQLSFDDIMNFPSEYPSY